MRYPLVELGAGARWCWYLVPYGACCLECLSLGYGFDLTHVILSMGHIRRFLRYAHARFQRAYMGSLLHGAPGVLEDLQIIEHPNMVV